MHAAVEGVRRRDLVFDGNLTKSRVESLPGVQERLQRLSQVGSTACCTRRSGPAFGIWFEIFINQKYIDALAALL
jgi:hypothetical protein